MRKLALGAWGNPNDPTANVQLDLDITKLLQHLESTPEIKLKHAIIKILAKILHEVPELNTILIRNKFRKRLNNRLFIPTIFRDKNDIDLNGIFIDDAHRLSLKNLRKVWDKKISALRSGNDRPTKRVVRVFKALPDVLCKPLIKCIDFIQYTCNISLNRVGLPTDPFGSMTVTFLDKFNIRYANIPLYSFSRSAITVAVGKVYKDDEKRLLPLTCTFDHRCFDGFEGGLAVKKFNYYLQNPHEL